MDRLEEQFLLYNSYLTHEDVCRTLWMLGDMTEQVRMDVVAACADGGLRRKLLAKAGLGTTAVPQQWLQTTAAVVGLTNGRHGPATIIRR